MDEQIPEIKKTVAFKNVALSSKRLKNSALTATSTNMAWYVIAQAIAKEELMLFLLPQLLLHPRGFVKAMPTSLLFQ